MNIAMNMSLALGKLSFNAGTRKRTWRKLAIQAQNGLTIDDSLAMLHTQAQDMKSPLASLYQHFIVLRGSGQTFDTILSGVATPEEIQLIRSGQDTGKLPEALLMAVKLLESKEKIRTAVIGIVAYPSLLISMCVALLLIVALQVVPQLSLITDPTLWVGMSGMLYSISDFVASWKGVTLLVVLLVTCGVIAFSLPRWTGHMRKNFDAYPPWSMYRMLTGSVWLFTTATLMESGVALKSVMEHMLNAAHTTPYLKERLQGIFIHQSSGENLGDAMFLCGYHFPDKEVIGELRTYAKLPNFESQLLHLAEQWMDEGIERIQQRAQIFSVLCMLFIVVLVSVLGIAIMDMQSQIMNI